MAFTHKRWLDPTFLLLIFLTSLGALVLTVLFVLWQAAIPRPDLQDAGAIAEFDTREPTLRYLTTRDGKRTTIWITLSNGEWRAFVPTIQRGRWYCAYSWQPVTQRFEDPCSGAKFDMTGMYRGDYVSDWESYAQDLDQYRVEIHDGHLWVNLDFVRQGRIRQPHPPD